MIDTAVLHGGGAERAAALQVEHHVLPNGLRVVLNPEPSLPIAGLSLWYHAGSRNDPPGRSGTAHLLEHMLFQNGSGQGYVGRINRLGGTANGSTWYDRTSYFATVPPHALHLALWLEARRMHAGPSPSPERLETQRAVILNERRQVFEMRPYGNAHELLHELLFPEGHPYRVPAIGRAAEIAKIQRGDLHDFFRVFYVPENAVLTVAGDFDVDETLGCIGRYFGDIPSRALPAGGAPALPVSEPGSLELRHPVDLARVYVAFRLPAYGDPRWHAADLLAAALATGRSSVLQRELVHGRPWALDVGHSITQTEWCATLTLTVVCRPGVEPERVRGFLFDFLLRLAREPLADSLVRRGRHRVLTQFFRDLQMVEKRADALSRLMTYFGDVDLLGREVEIYRRLRAEDLSAVAACLQPEQAAVLIYLPAH